MLHKNKTIIVLGLLLLILVLGACADEPAQAPAPAEDAAAEVPAEEAPAAEAPVEEAPAEETEETEMEPIHWSYEGEGGPEYWGSLELEYAACSEGMEQSPVNILCDAPINPDDVAFAYGETAVIIVNNGHAIQVNYDEGSTAVIDGSEYALQQFHFHSLSEHTMGGENAAMEMHLVHADADGNNAVIGVMLVEGAENPAFAPVWDNMPAEEGDPVTIDGAFVNVDDLLPTDRSYYAYEGSLTTPPCTEGVHWHVLSESVALSAEQIDAFRAIHDGTNRPIQPRNEREFISKVEAVHWSYEGEGGPENWGSLEPEYAACSAGLEQSPVDIPADTPIYPDDVGYAYAETAVNIVNNGHAIQVNYDEGSTAVIDGSEYALQQFHFHSLSEHTLAGGNKDMEMHLVHADANGNNAVISVMLVEGAENPAFASVWDNMPAEEGDPVTIEGAYVNVSDLLPADRSYYRYSGSLTTPPCTEGVNWHVLATPVELSADQLAQFRAIHDGTNRPVQPMNDRMFADPEVAEAVHWSYEGETGPEYWGTLEEDYAACGVGLEQSPVNIFSESPVNPDDVGYVYADTAVNIVNNGHAIQVNYDEGSTSVIDGTEYALQQFHFHSLSEHTYNGVNAPMEMHLVHADANGNNAVIGVLIIEGAENAAFDPVWDNMPAEEGDPVTIEGAFVNADNLLPANRSYYQYDGSLTTPPCTEGVLWHVLAEPVQLSSAQIADFRAIHDGTNRPVQPMNDRAFIGPEEEAAEGEVEEVHWSYEGETGPAYWGTLKPEYAACGVGLEQSPVDITAEAPVNPDDVTYSYAETSVNIENNGDAIQVNYNDGSTAVIDGTEYGLQQFHFHSLSEHTIGGTNGAMEMHLVHTDANGNNAVIGVLLVKGRRTPLLRPFGTTCRPRRRALYRGRASSMCLTLCPKTSATIATMVR